MTRAAALIALLVSAVLAGGSMPTQAALRTLKTVSVTLPGIACPGTGMAGERIPPPRKSFTVKLPIAVSTQLSFYGAYGSAVILAPKGWTCTSTSGSGGVTIEAVNRKAGFFGVGTYTPQQAITLDESSTGTNHPLFDACQFFDGAAAQIGRQGFSPADSCTYRRVIGEQTVLASQWLLTFLDPAGVKGLGQPSGGRNPANGMILFDDAGQYKARSSRATCTLPAAQHSLCTVILNEYISRWRARKS